MESPTLDTFTRAYLEAALFTDNPFPSSGEFSETEYWCIERIDPASLARAVADCAAFQAAHAEDIAEDIERAGRDFWYTRNGHGCGFWDGDWPEEIGERLTETCKGFREMNVSFSDQGEPEPNGSATMIGEEPAEDRVIYIE